MRKMEQTKHLDPYLSHSFQELSDVLLQNYKDSSSAGSSAFGSYSMISGINNQLREKALKPTTTSEHDVDEDGSQSAYSQDGSSGG